MHINACMCVYFNHGKANVVKKLPNLILLKKIYHIIEKWWCFVLLIFRKKKLKDKNQIKKSHCLGLVLWLIFKKKISWCLSYLFPEIDVILSLSFSFFLNFNFLLFFIFSLCVIELFCLTWGSWFILPSKKLLIS